MTVPLIRKSTQRNSSWPGGSTLHTKAEYICADLSIAPSLFPCSQAADHTFPGTSTPNLDRRSAGLFPSCRRTTRNSEETLTEASQRATDSRPRSSKTPWRMGQHDEGQRKEAVHHAIGEIEKAQRGPFGDDGQEYASIMPETIAPAPPARLTILGETWSRRRGLPEWCFEKWMFVVLFLW